MNDLVTCSIWEREHLQVHPASLEGWKGATLCLVLPRNAGQGQFKRPQPGHLGGPTCYQEANPVRKHRKQAQKMRNKVKSSTTNIPQGRLTQREQGLDRQVGSKWEEQGDEKGALQIERTPGRESHGTVMANSNLQQTHLSQGALLSI